MNALKKNCKGHEWALALGWVKEAYMGLGSIDCENETIRADDMYMY